MIPVGLFLLTSASAERFGLAFGLGPTQVRVDHHRQVFPKLEMGVALGGSRFSINDCELVYLDPNSTAGSFECSPLTIWAAILDVEGLYTNPLPRMMGFEPSIAFGPFVGCGVYEKGLYERIGVVSELKLNQKPIDLGFRVTLGHHGLLNTQWGVSFLSSFTFGAVKKSE